MPLRRLRSVDRTPIDLPHFVIPAKVGIQKGWGEGNVMRGRVPHWGGGGAWHNELCQFAVPSHSIGSSYLGVPAPIGMSDCYESMAWTPIRDRLPPLISSFQRRRESKGGGGVASMTPKNVRRRPESRGEGECKTTANPWMTTDVRESRTPDSIRDRSTLNWADLA